jgi:hypothetical protein
MRFKTPVVALASLCSVSLGLGLSGATFSYSGVTWLGAYAADQPVANKDHWHAAYGVFVCNKYLPPIKSNGQDPTGIHTHEDGLIHIHPFGAAAEGKNAIMARFFEAEGLQVTTESIRFNTSTYRSGGKCGTKAATVKTLVWLRGSRAKPIVYKGDPSLIRLEENATYAFVYAPSKVDVPPPPSQKELRDPADLPPPPLTPQQLATIPPPPKTLPQPVLPKGNPPTEVMIKDLVVGTGIEAREGTRLYVRYRVTSLTGVELDSSSWQIGDQPAALPRLGKGRLMPGLEKGLPGMKLGGIRQIIIPPTDGAGSGNDNQTIVFIAQLVAVSGLTDATPS